MPLITSSASLLRLLKVHEQRGSRRSGRPGRSRLLVPRPPSKPAAGRRSRWRASRPAVDGVHPWCWSSSYVSGFGCEDHLDARAEEARESDRERQGGHVATGLDRVDRLRGARPPTQGAPPARGPVRPFAHVRRWSRCKPSSTPQLCQVSLTLGRHAGSGVHCGCVGKRALSLSRHIRAACLWLAVAGRNRVGT